MSKNRIEEELDAIRIKLYEETKDLTMEERIKRVNDKAKKLAEQYGFTIVSSARRNIEKKEVG
jgi:septin family protein